MYLLSDLFLEHAVRLLALWRRASSPSAAICAVEGAGKTECPDHRDVAPCRSMGFQLRFVDVRYSGLYHNDLRTISPYWPGYELSKYSRPAIRPGPHLCPDYSLRFRICESLSGATK